MICPSGELKMKDKEIIVQSNSMWLIRFVVAFLFLGLISCNPPKESGSKESSDSKLNVVFILSDALRAANLPMYGYKRNTSPNLSALASRSILFMEHFSNAPATRVSISQLFTGRMIPPMIMGSKDSTPVKWTVPKNLLVLPRVFRDAGYRTAIISSHPYFNPGARVLNSFEKREIIDPPKKVPKKRPYAHYEEMASSIKSEIIAAQNDKRPFFLYIHSMDTHGPFRFHKGFDHFREDKEWYPVYNKYDSEILYTDHWVHKIITQIDESGLKDNTIVLFTADHGEQFNEMGHGWWNRTHGPNLRRAAVHIPLIVRLPGKLAVTGKYQGITQHIDLAPTLARLAISDVDLSQYHFEGHDLSGDLRKKRLRPSDPRSAVAENTRYWSLRDSKYPMLESQYDKWADKVSVFRIVPDRFNYPRPLPEEEDNYSTLFDKNLRNKIKQSKQSADNSKIEAKTGVKAKPATTSGMMYSVVPSTDRRTPSFDNTPKDNRWHFRPGRLIVCHPDETPGAITLKKNIVDGKYRIRVVLDKPLVTKGFRNGFRIKIGSDANGPVVVFPKGGKERGTKLDVGVHELKGVSGITIDEPQGGVAIVKFIFEYQGVEEKKEKPVDRELVERLKALGYVE